MPPHPSSKPPPSADATHAAGEARPVRALTTVTGVQVNVSSRELPSIFGPPAPAPAPPPAPVVVRPPGEAERARDAILARVAVEHGQFIETTLRARDVLPASAKDLAQEVLLVLRDQLDPYALPANMRGFIVEIIRHQVCNHGRLKRLRADGGVEADVEAGSAENPERLVAAAEERARMLRYVDALPPLEQAVVRDLDFEELTLAATGAKRGLPIGTVATVHLRAKAMLKELGRASDRATALGARLPPR